MKIKYAVVNDVVFTPDCGDIGNKLSISGTSNHVSKVLDMDYNDGILEVSVKTTKSHCKILLPVSSIRVMQAVEGQAASTEPTTAPAKKGFFI